MCSMIEPLKNITRGTLQEMSKLPFLPHSLAECFAPLVEDFSYTFEAVIVCQPSQSTVCKELANLIKSRSSVFTKRGWLAENGARHKGHSGDAFF